MSSKWRFASCYCTDLQESHKELYLNMKEDIESIPSNLSRLPPETFISDCILFSARPSKGVEKARNQEEYWDDRNQDWKTISRNWLKEHNGHTVTFLWDYNLRITGKVLRIKRSGVMEEEYLYLRLPDGVDIRLKIEYIHGRSLRCLKEN